jgi:Bromodomain
VAWFLHPVSDKLIIQDYRRKIKHPMDLNTMQGMLERNEYTTVSELVLDLRRIFANCLQFNTSIKDPLRPIAVECLVMAEELMMVFLAQPEHPTLAYPPQLYCWKLCLSVLDTLYNLTNPGNEQPTVLYFLYPVSFYCGGQFPPDYLDKVSKPMDFGTVTKNLIEGEYTSVEKFGADCRLVIENCMAYYGEREDGKIFTEMANRLNDVLQQQLDALTRYLKSPAGEPLKSRAATAVTIFSLPKPPIPLLMGTLEELRALKYTDRGTKVRQCYCLILFDFP